MSAPFMQYKVMGAFLRVEQPMTVYDVSRKLLEPRQKLKTVLTILTKKGYLKREPVKKGKKLYKYWKTNEDKNHRHIMECMYLKGNAKEIKIWGLQ